MNLKHATRAPKAIIWALQMGDHYESVLVSEPNTEGHTNLEVGEVQTNGGDWGLVADFGYEAIRPDGETRSEMSGFVIDGTYSPQAALGRFFKEWCEYDESFTPTDVKWEVNYLCPEYAEGHGGESPDMYWEFLVNRAAENLDYIDAV